MQQLPSALQCDRHASNLAHHGELLLKPIRFEAENKSVFSSEKTPSLLFVCSPSNAKMSASYNETAATAETLQQPVGWKTFAVLFFSLCPFPRILRAACSHFFLPKSQWQVTQRQSEKLIISENSARWMCKIKWNLSNPTVFARWTEDPHFWHSQSDLTCCNNSNIVSRLQCRVRVWLIFSTRSEWFWYLYS